MMMLRRRVQRARAGERGSMLVSALMITFVLTLLGIALFDLSALDARLAMGSEGDYRALEMAQSAFERGLHRLYLDFCNNEVACLNPPLIVSWADGDINGTLISNGNTTSFQTLNASTTGFADASGFGPTGAKVAYTSTYSIAVKLLTGTEASNLGVVCSAPAPSSPCTDAIYLRTTASFTPGNVPSVTRTLQAIVHASFNGFGDGIISGSPASGSIQGNAEIHGSLHILPCGTNPCTPLVFSGGAGMRNNYNGLATSIQNVIPRLPTIVCAAGTACAGLTVETINASVRIAKPDDGPVDIGSAAISIGESGSGSVNAVTSIRGKPTYEGVFLGNGCQIANCSDQVLNRPQNVYSDRPIKGYDINPAPSFPILSDPVKIFGIDYDDYAACSGPGACNVSGAVVSGSGNDFFISHAAKIKSTAPGNTMEVRDEDTTGCPTPGTCTRNLYQLMGNGATWDDATPSFSATFVCTVAICDDTAATPNRLNGSINGNKPPGLQLEWNQPTATISIYACPIGQPVNCGIPTLADGGVGLITPAGTRRYRVTFVNGAGVETDVTLPSGHITTANLHQINLTNIPLGPAGTVSKNLYRTTNALDNVYRRVNLAPILNATTTFTDVIPDAALGALLTLTGLLSDATPDPLTRYTLPLMIYVDGQLKICADCSNKTFYYRGNAAFLVKGVVADTTANTTLSNFSIWIDPDLFACPNGCPADNLSFPYKHLFTFYTPGNIEMGQRSQRNFMGQFYAMGKWETSKQTNVVGAVTARIFNITAQVPSFWEVKMPRTQTAFPPRGSRWSVARVPGKWKECVGAVPFGAC